MEVIKMTRLTIICTSFIIVSLMFAGQSYAEIDPQTVLGAWLLDEGTGNIAEDASGNGNDGTLMGAPNWVAGWSGNALEFIGSGTYVDCGNAEALNVGVFSVSFWCNIPSTQGWNHIISKGNHGASGTPGSVNWGVMMYSDEQRILFETYNNTSWTAVIADTTAGEWHHVVATFDGSILQLYHDGQSVGTSGGGILLDPSRPFLIGARSDAGSAGGFFNGSIDEVGYFNIILSLEDIEAIMNDGLAGITGAGRPLARRPNPEDGALLDQTWGTLSWSPGDFAVSHDTYLGNNFDDVNDATRESTVFRGNQDLDSLYLVAGITGYPYPDGLVPGTTYYWRIDEVNDADPNSPWKGYVWSFTVPSRKAIEPTPVDGSDFINAEAVTLGWTEGFGSVFHYVYFGDDFDTVANDADGPFQVLTTYDPGALESGKTYFWRIDEFDGTTTHTGDVWSFKTLPYIPITDPNLVGWWKLDEGSGVFVLDGSGYSNHGTLKGDTQWVIGHDGDALEFTGLGTYVDCGNAEALNVGIFSVSFWYNIPSTQGWNHMVSKGSHASAIAVNWGVMMYDAQETILFETFNDTTWTGITADTTTGEWHHVVATYDGDTMQLYHDGALADTTSGTGMVLDQSRPLLIGANSDAGSAGGSFSGSVDDVRIYNKVLTQDEVQQAMQGDPTLAWKPGPANKSTPDIHSATSLSWAPGEKAAQHDVYFGTDKDAVNDADTTTADIYRGRQAATSYSPPESIEWGGGPYYWRIDEYNTDDTISKGKLWSFTVADFILVDNFEAYDVGNNEIWFAWNDGLGAGSPGSPGYIPGNGTGSEIGDGNTGSYTEETIIHGGSQSMPYWYDNNKQGFNKYSEAKLTLIAPRDWTQEGVKELSLWFRGYPSSVGSFAEGPVGTYTMTASGVDIWNTSDEFHFAYKMLTGVGSIQAQVLSIDNTANWAKAGVMIRETLDPDSAHAMMVVTPANGVSFQRRPGTGAASTSANSTTGNEAAPYWVKIERDIAGNFTGSSSTNGSAWTPLDIPVNIAMSSNVYIGLALTSTNASQTCQGVFSNVTTTGTVSPLWANQDIGVASNDAELLYVAVSNSAGTPAVVVHDDPAAATIDTWTEWIIPLQDLADQGLILTDVDSIAIGLGTQGNTTIPGGSGKMYFDDIRLYRSREAAE